MIFSDKCISCGGAVAVESLCNGCFNDIRFLRHEVTADVHEHCSRLFAVTAYEGPVLDVVHALKYGRDRSAIRAVSRILEGGVGGLADADCIVPVPLNWLRYAGRGYNQAVIIAGLISGLLGRPALGRAIVKKKRTPPQVGKDLAERKKNLKGAFGVPPFFRQSVRGKRALLVDDVVTSGATIDECARVLIRAGASDISALALAKTL